MIAGTNLLNNRLRLRSHSIRRTFVRAGRAVFSQLIRWVDLGTAVSEFYPRRLFSNIHFDYGFVTFGITIRRGIPGTPTLSNARILGSPRFHFYRVTFGLHAIAYRRIIQRGLLFLRTRLIGRDGRLVVFAC